MKIISKKDLSKKDLSSISKQVEKQIKPNISFKGGLELDLDGKKITGTYQNVSVPTFTIDEAPVKKEVKPEKATETSLMKLTKVELQALCESNKVEFETDSNKATLVSLLLPVLNGAN